MSFQQQGTFTYTTDPFRRAFGRFEKAMRPLNLGQIVGHGVGEGEMWVHVIVYAQRITTQSS